MSSRYILVWFAMLIIAFANGTLREVLLVRWLEPTTARQVSTMILLIVFGIVIFAAARRWPFRSRMHALAVGLTWAAATVLFEVFLGRVTGQSWAQIRSAYDISSGNLWPVVPPFIAVTPVLLSRRS